MESEEGRVYLVKFDDRHYKIGKSKIIPKRIKAFKGKKPIVIHSILSNEPYRLETYFHRRFADKRILDELFELNEDEIKVFQSVSKVFYHKYIDNIAVNITEDEYWNKYFHVEQENARLEMITKAMSYDRKELREKISSLTEQELDIIIDKIMEYAGPLSYSGSLG